MTIPADPPRTDQPAPAGDAVAVPRVGLLRPWRPGQSGNPSGTRHVDQRFRRMIRAALEACDHRPLLDPVRDPKHKHHWDAVELAYAYAYGRPSQTLDVEGSATFNIMNVFAGYTEEQLAAMMAELRARIAALPPAADHAEALEGAVVSRPGVTSE